MFGLVDVVLVTAVAACGYALWVRRHTWGSRWDTNPSRILVLIVSAGLLMSPLGTTFFDPLVHRVFGLWNVAGLLAVLCLFCAMWLLSEHLVTRLTDQDRVRLLERRYVKAPLIFGLPPLVIVFCVADRGHPEYLDVFAPRGPWFGAYWALIAAMALYLFGLAGRMLLPLRHDPRSKTAAEGYLACLVFEAGTMVCQLTSVLIGSSATLPSWVCAGAAAIAFAFASAQSWRARIAWFKPFKPIAPEVAGD